MLYRVIKNKLFVSPNYLNRFLFAYFSSVDFKRDSVASTRRIMEATDEGMFHSLGELMRNDDDDDNNKRYLHKTENYMLLMKKIYGN